MPRHAARGFTLMEVLIACALVGLVLAMSMQGFMAINKVSNLSRSRMLGQSEAAKAVQEITQLLKRAHIIYFNALPLGVQSEVNLAGANPNAMQNNPVIANNSAGAAAPPTALTTLAGGQQNIPYMFGSANLANLADHTVAGMFGPANKFRRQQFRVLNGGALTAGARLRSGDPSTVAGVDRDFPSPLLYWAEATFVNAPDAANANRIMSANIPRSWNFYVLYLAPMNLPRAHAALSFAGPPFNFAGDFGARRTIAAGAPAAQRVYPRSTIPFELRLLTISNVPARKTLSPDNYPADMPTDPSEAGSGHFLGAPFDHYRPGPAGSIGGQRAVNYDPYALPMQAGSATTLDRMVTRSGTSIWGSGERVNGGGNHGNYNNIGNDPPTDAVLNYRSPAQATDRVLASYVDPDSVLGTTVKLGNNLSAAGAGPLWVDAYLGPHMWNTNGGAIPAAPNGKAPPRRAMISVTTRFRNDRRIPFQFATETAEVELEALTGYQSYVRTKRD